MSKSYRLAGVLAALLCLSGQAAANTPAGDRAYLYQREARTVLENRGWHVSHDENGKLIADHPLGPLGTGGGGAQVLGLRANPMPSNGPLHAFAWLTLTFTPVSVTRTHCAANIVAYIFWGNLTGEQIKRVKPAPFNNPESTEEIQAIMSKAEAALTAKHPEYARH